MKRIYHPYWKWEDYLDGMWRVVPKPEDDLLFPKAVEFTGNAELYGSFMLRVAQEWPIACEQNLTNEGMNRLAWIGHAACSMAIHCPEYITRRAWSSLKQRQRDDANAKAQYAVEMWLHSFRMNRDQYAITF